jgi:hypothetical protein
MLETFTWLFRALGIAPIVRNTSSYQLSKVGVLTTATHITVILYCYYVFFNETVETRYFSEFRTSGVISDIYLASWRYLGDGLRMTYIIAVLKLIERYLKARNKMLRVKQKWAMLHIWPKGASRAVEVISVFGLASILFCPFIVVAWYESPSIWQIVIVHDCDFLYEPATVLHFLLCLYEIKVNYDQIFDVLIKKFK